MLKVEMLAHTPRPDKVIAMAGKLCYSPVGIEELKENLTPIKSERFVNKLLSMGHESPLEHVTFTFGIEGISRACSHQLVRHRIASYSQQSQRYVKLEQFEYIIPPAIEKNEELKEVFIDHMMKTQDAYDILVERLLCDIILEKYPNECEECFEEWSNNQYIDGYDDLSIFKDKYKKKYLEAEKQAIEDARYVFPNACETKIVVTMNVRTLYHFFQERCCERAQWEIREMATEMLKQCKEVSPILFANCGPKCVKDKCPEGSMSCGMANEKRDMFGGDK